VRFARFVPADGFLFGSLVPPQQKRGSGRGEESRMKNNPSRDGYKKEKQVRSSRKA
jgi:hypothetical protein